VEDCYEFDEESWTTLAAASVDWRDVIAVLYGRPRHRQHLDAGGLIVSGRARDGRWLMVGLSERPDRDDAYLIRQVLVMTPEQRRAIERRMGGGAG
jgi:hypothetical protein